MKKNIFTLFICKLKVNMNFTRLYGLGIYAGDDVSQQNTFQINVPDSRIMTANSICDYHR